MNKDPALVLAEHKNILSCFDIPISESRDQCVNVNSHDLPPDIDVTQEQIVSDEDDALMGSEEFMQALIDRMGKAVAAEIARHHAAGRSVYVTDDDGDVCAYRPDGTKHKLSAEEIEQLIAEKPVPDMGA